MPNLGNCRDCGKEVSTTATACPHCGRDQPTRGVMDRQHSCLGCLLGAVLILALLWFLGQCASF